MSDSKKTNILTPRRTVSYFFLEVITIGIAGMIIWPLLDLLLSKTIENKDFVWNVKDHIVEPLIFALLITIIEFIFWKRFHKENKK